METAFQRSPLMPGRYRYLLMLLICSGCVTLDIDHASLPWEALPHGEIRQVLVLWADGIDVRPDPMRGGLPTPGFAGRVYLFGKELGTPRTGDGALTVFLYDDAQPPAAQPAPREVWNIDAANFEQVLKKDGLGWGYNVWLPWSNYRPEIRKVMLVARYQPKKGQEAWSSTAVLSLGTGSGPKRPSRMQQTRSAVKK